ncbi:MAG TPA: hypothetical protein VGG82_07780 [Casimicrobiaceae bacterium]|jgi:hypothetical protein
MPDHPVPAPARPLTPDEVEQLREWAFGQDTAIKGKRHEIEGSLWDLAKLLYEWNMEQGHRWLGGDDLTLGEWLADPEITMTRTQYFRLIRVYENFCVNGKVPIERMRGLSTRKADEVTPAIKAGRIVPKRALDDIDALGVRDLREKYAESSRVGTDDGSDSAAVGGDDDVVDVSVQGDDADGQGGPLDEPGTASDADGFPHTRAALQLAGDDLQKAADSGAAMPRILHDSAVLGAEAVAAYTRHYELILAAEERANE